MDLLVKGVEEVTLDLMGEAVIDDEVAVDDVVNVAEVDVLLTDVTVEVFVTVVLEISDVVFVAATLCLLT